jgi:hypothetical protein
LSFLAHSISTYHGVAGDTTVSWFGGGLGAGGEVVAAARAMAATAVRSDELGASTPK